MLAGGAKAYTLSTRDRGDTPVSAVERNNLRITGSGKQPMMFSHGFGCDQNMWRLVAPAFERTHRTVLFDHVGAGRSDLSAYSKAKYSSLQGYADDVLEICRELGLQDVIFVGHSVSAMIGVLAANREPERFAKLVLVGPSPRYIDDEGGQAAVTEAPFDPRALVGQTADALLGRAEEKGIVLRQEIDARVPASLAGDAIKIQQVLANLLGNAVKFTESGSITVSLRLVQLERESATVQFGVADTGIGIAPDRLAAVFEEFTQADAEIGRKYGGTGLGLTISRRLVELQGGELTVESVLGKGSTFRFELRLRTVPG
jgi:pimeloyl-ACP methyl ester carboxylesterase